MEAKETHVRTILLAIECPMLVREVETVLLATSYLAAAEHRPHRPPYGTSYVVLRSRSSYGVHLLTTTSRNPSYVVDVVA